ncbi:hypothetical protein SAMN05443662_0022 [Sulfurivirga caldicuralii]|uniref:Uncharacterized protein n=1 Tax=Sulfurivirga caldicuralii TaxID=364032 RepID=A0A1N6DBU2_9GAMM|nr:hypothetical protein [Sulfurivirga caldicuralii]SIN68260.1 hypothetical protein SAMN05443662_0022 [Sulfurivirga caldicuralii]
MNKTALFKKSGTPLLAALLLVWSSAHAAGEAWPQPEEAYNSTQPRAQWLDTTPANNLPQPVAPQQQAQPQSPAVPAPTPYAAPAYGGYGGYPAYGYAPRGYAPPAYGYGYGYAPRHRNNSWWPGNGSWPNMNNWSMPSPSFSTPSFSIPSNPFGW